VGENGRRRGRAWFLHSGYCGRGCHHPHVHCVLAAGGLAPDHARWISSHRTFFLPVKVLSRVFRGKFVAGLKTAFHAGALQFHGHLLPLAQPRAFAAWLRVLFRHDWVVYAKRPFGGPEHVLRYLGAYTHRVAISNSRLLALSEGNVTFRWRDSAHGNKKRLMTLPVEEFLRRFLLHLLPRGFMRIRNFGFLANRRRTELLPLCLRLLQPSGQSRTGATPSALPTHSLWQCPLCGGTMQIVERLSAAQLCSSLAFTRGSRNAASLCGSRSPARMALRMACPVTPLTSLNTLANWIFICVSAFCIRWMCETAARMRSLRCRQYVRIVRISCDGRNEFRSRP